MAPKSRGKTLASANKNLSVPPVPFSVAPDRLFPFLSKLSKRHVYITSIDTQPRQFKAKIFAVPLLTNLVILGLLLWRAWAMMPYYYRILSGMVASHNTVAMGGAQSRTGEMRPEILRRTGNLIFDLLLYTLLWPWPRAFFGPSRNENPIAWRFCIGFRDQEITVRRSRNWDESVGDVVKEGGEGTEGGNLFLNNVRMATSRASTRGKTGYSLLDRNWDLDWRLMILGTTMVDEGELTLGDFKSNVLVHSEQFGWVLFRTEDDHVGGDTAEAGRKKILAFKDELTKMGKENLFFKWVELVQFESSQPGGFGPEQQEKTMLKAKVMFEEQGIDFEAFWEKIGGMAGMPGMEQH